MARVFSFDELHVKLKVIRDLASTMIRDLKDTEKYKDLLIRSDEEGYSSMAAALDARIVALDYLRDDISDRLGLLQLSLWDRHLAANPESANLIQDVAITIGSLNSILFTFGNGNLTNLIQNGDEFEIIKAENPDHLGIYTVDSSSSTELFFSPTPVTGVAFTPSSITRAGAVATVTTPDTLVNLGLATGDYVVHDGADQTEYNKTAQITGTGASTYTYAVSGTPVTPATGTLTAQKAAASNASDTSFEIRLYAR